MDNFDLKKFLVENKITPNSRLEEIKAIPGNTGMKKDLLSFIKQNQDEVAEKIGAVRLEDIEIDNLNNPSAIAVFDIDLDDIWYDEDEDEDEDEIEDGLLFNSGVSFSYPEDVDDDFKGENGDEPISLEVAGKQLMYISYNI
jgi:hypothetical protein